MNTTEGRGEDQRLIHRVLWLNAKILGLSTGLILGLLLFIATNWLVIKGGNPLGPHLNLLGQYFIGYRVSFTGSLVGFFYGFIVGSTSGALIGWIYNKIVAYRNG